MAKTTTTRTNRLNVEWNYAQACYSALRNSDPIPPIPEYEIWQKEADSTNPEKLVGKKLIEPQRVTCNGVSVY